MSNSKKPILDFYSGLISYKNNPAGNYKVRDNHFAHGVTNGIVLLVMLLCIYSLNKIPPPTAIWLYD